MSNPFNNRVRNDFAYPVDRKCAAMVRAEAKRRGMTIAEVSDFVGIGGSVFSRFLNWNMATDRTLNAVQKHLGLKFPPIVSGPRDDYKIESMEHDGDGWRYVVRSANQVMRGWRKGARSEVEKYIDAMLARINNRKLEAWT